MTPRRLPGPVAGELAVFVLAAVARLAVVITSGGFGGNYGYDAGVYYAASDALVHGRVPYRDFVLLHPPGLMLALAPFAWFGRVTSDHAGFVTASLAFTGLGAVNAVLVVRVARRLGVAAGPALLGGGFYALWYGAIRAEYLPRLEPLGNFLLLTGLLALAAAGDSGRGRTAVAGAFALGAAASVKIWWAVPMLLVLAWHLGGGPGWYAGGGRGRYAGGGRGWRAGGGRGWRRLALPLAGGAGALILLNGPFLLLAGGQMWQMVVTQQLGRGRDRNSAATRLAQLSGLDHLSTARPVGLALLALVAAVALAACSLAWRVPRARLVVVLAAVQVAVLVTAPSWFSFYTDYAAPAAALTLAAAAGALTGRAAARDGRAAVGNVAAAVGNVAAAVGNVAAAARDGRAGARGPRRLASAGQVVAWLPVAAAGLETVLLVLTGRSNVVAPFPRAPLARAVADTRCLMSDSAMALIQLNALSRGLAHGCRNWVDVTGRTYGPDKPASPGIPRRANQKWQADVRAYLLSGDAVIVIRADGTGLSAATAAAIRQGGVLASAGGHVVYRTPG